MMEFLLIVLAMLLLLLLQGFFSGSEIALVNADKLKLRHQANKGHKGAMLVTRMQRQPEVILGTTLVGTNVVLVALTTLGTLLTIRLVGENGDLVAFLVFTPLLLVFGEVVPKSVYQQNANQLAPRIIFPLRAFSLLFYPAVFVFSRLARVAVRLVGIKASRQSLFTMREQVRMMLEGAEQATNVDVFDRYRLIRAVRFAETTVGQVMVPIDEVVMMNHRQNIAEAIEVARTRGHSRIPVYGDEPAKIVGILMLGVWELMDPDLKNKTLEELYRPVLYVVENQPADEILAELQNRDDHMAIVVDEFGSAMGMITLDDLLEEVLGEVVNLGQSFESHVTRHKGHIEKLPENCFRIDGRVPLIDVADALEISLPFADVHTLGGLVMQRLRHLPRPGESILVARYRFTVETVTEKGVKSIVAEPL